ncbi:MAG: NERD domain-containing protein [Bacteroidaceae bacterium]|nr:NERD domain-containing protein [Bacteroidaceae bacterium]
MATFYPSLETIAKFKVPPTEGERTLLDFLGKVLDDSYEVYFNPYLNGDRPDVLIMRKGNGVLVIEVKDWNLDNFKLDEKKKWIYIPNGAVVKSPINQVFKYKENLFDLHVDNLLEKRINDVRHFQIVACAVYFHCATQSKVENLLINPYKDDKRYSNFLKYNIDFIGRDALEERYFNSILRKRYLSKDQHSFLFLGDIYDNFKRILSPTMHMKAQGEPYTYSPKQKEIIYGRWENGELKVQLEQRIKGVFGSGKTTVMAARAVQAYKRALKRNNYPRILILTFNITLRNFIHDKLMRVDEVFPVESFIIINYHQFINAELNNLNIEIVVPKDIPQEKVGDYLERNYYSNIKLFDEHKSQIVKYDAVFIDEIQDYHRPWMDIIKNYFRDPQGDYVLFGDVKQNIYGQPTSQKDVVTNVLGVNELKYCYRSDFKVRDLAQSYQLNIFQNKYDIDNFDENNKIGPLGLTIDKIGYINYMYLSDTNTIATLYNIIRGNILNKVNDIAPNDITILGYTASQLRLFDCYYRYASRERVNSMLETIEAMYMTHLNYFGKDMLNADGWFKNISSHLTKKLFPKKSIFNDQDLIKLRQHIAKLLTIYDLYSSYTDTFNNRLNEECSECGISTEAFLAFVNHYKDELKPFKATVYNDDYKYIRDNKKLHFWMNSGTIKISTINSFKGWESEAVFLILEQKYNTTNSFNLSFDELLYTGLTRCKRNLVILNFGNEEYDKKMRPLIERLK